MATYYHGAPEIQPDGLQTLYLMNPGYVGYQADAASPSSNVIFMNPAGSPINTTSTLPQPQQHQHLVGIPLHQPAASLPEVPTAHGLLARVQYNLWNPTPITNSVDVTSQLGLRQASTAPISSSQQGLSLSLSPQQPNYATQPSPQTVTTATIPSAAGEEARLSGSFPSAASNGIVGLQGVLLGSKYLKTAQQILDEVVNVGKEIKVEPPKPAKANQESEHGKGGETSSEKQAADLTTAEKQELHMKKAKLVNMLDEVEQRYRQYYHQMQTVISSFEAIAGVGSARTYTALALRTISKQFRCLRDVISGQIRSASKSLGDEDFFLGSKSEGGSRLRFVDHHLRQQRALQQLGMMQHNAWRPQRGLPERSVSVLRAWLFEHFLHPYPKDSDKHMLAKQTGLTRNQVSNWFINARVRLWKPMVEEMYLEETKEQERLSNANGDDKTSKSEDTASKSTAPVGSPSRTEHETQGGENPRTQTGYDEDDMINSKLKKARSNETSGLLQHHHQLTTAETNLKPVDAGSADLFMRFNDAGGFGGYSIGGMSRFDGVQFGLPPRLAGNGVSLTLGLQHSEGGVPLTGTPTTYLSSDGIQLGRRLQELSNAAGAIEYAGLATNSSSTTNNNNSMSVMDHSPSAYGSIGIQGSKRFSSHQLLPDFVA